MSSQQITEAAEVAVQPWRLSVRDDVFAVQEVAMENDEVVELLERFDRELAAKRSADAVAARRRRRGARAVLRRLPSQVDPALVSGECAGEAA